MFRNQSTRWASHCLLLLALAGCLCEAFQSTTTSSSSSSSSRISLLQAVDKKQDASTSTTGRKPRFAQQAHKESLQQRPLQEPPQRRERRPSSAAAAATSSNSSPTTERPVRKNPVKPLNGIIGSNPQRTTDSNNNSNNSNNNSNRRSTYIPPNVPWNSGKSVDELETIMTKRWGTDSKKWSDNDDDNDNDDDDDDGDYEIVNDPGDNKTPEFYDADDVGYERKRTGRQANNGKTNLNFDNIVSPKPVGGRGTRVDQKKENNYADEAKGGFFFQAPAAAVPRQETVASPPRQQRSDIITSDDDPQKPKREKQAKPPLVPLIKDENGIPLLLTLEQAQKNFNGMVASNDKDIDDDDRDTDVSSLETEANSWEELGITSPILLRNLQRMQCSKPLAVQAKACPSIITGQDVLVGTYTGSGKTLAFLVPLIERVLFSSDNNDDDAKDQALKILVVVPGRELASQVVSVARQLLEGTGKQAMLAIGGTGFSRNLQDIRAKKPSIVVGTPGRIAELIVGQPGEKGGRLKLPDLQSLVLDEFDALLEYKPHRDPTAAIVTNLKQRHRDALQAILCSATATDMLGSPKLDNYLRPGFAQAMADRDDVLVTSPTKGESGKAGKAITRVSRTVIHGVVHVEQRRLALETLRRILHTDPLPQQILIFVENARKVGIVVDKLDSMGILAAPLSGGPKSEKMDRAEVSKALREGFVGIVVATEMAARGLDAPLLTHVINLDLPTDASHYAHRAGRCGRGGRPGVVINLTTSPQERQVPQKFADRLGIAMHTVEARAGKLHIVEDSTE